MKTRQGFVSNSSSSSYLIRVLKETEEVCPHCGRGTSFNIFRNIFLKDPGPNHYCDDTGMGNKEYLLDMIEDAREEGRTQEADCLLNYYTDPTVFSVRVSYEDYGAKTVLKETAKAGLIEILQDRE